MVVARSVLLELEQVALKPVVVEAEGEVKMDVRAEPLAEEVVLEMAALEEVVVEGIEIPLAEPGQVGLAVDKTPVERESGRNLTR